MIIELLLIAQLVCPETSILSHDMNCTERRGTMGALEVVQAPKPPEFTISGTVLFLSWNAHPDQSVIGFRVYRGPTKLEATKFVSQTPETSVRYSARVLELHRGDPICFRLTAYNADGESGFTPGVCAQL